MVLLSKKFSQMSWALLALSTLVVGSVYSQDSEEYPVFQGKTSNTVNLFPVAKDEVEVEPVSNVGSLSVGLALNSLYPVSAPFTGTLASRGSQDFDFQVTTGVALEVGYAFSPQWEAAVSFGYEMYAAQISTGTASTPQFERAKLRQYPFMAIGRYKFRNMGFSPEFELGAGMSMAKVTVTSTSNGIDSISETSTPLRGHGAAGMGYSWMDGTSLHFQLGYAYYKLPAEEYVMRTGTSPYLTVEQKSMSGLYLKAMMRFNF